MIQDAVDAACPGDTIQIGPGWYQEYEEYSLPLQRRCVDVSYKQVLTLIGAGTDETLIGPTQLDGNINRQNSGVYGVLEAWELRVEDIKIVNMN